MMSYYGWLSWTDTYNLYKKWIKPKINFKKFRKRVGWCAQFDPMFIYRNLMKRYS